MIDPGTAMIVSAIIGGAAQGIGGMGKKKQAKRQARETRRETFSDILNNAMQRNFALEKSNLQGRSSSAQRRSQAMMDTAAMMREALRI